MSDYLWMGLSTVLLMVGLYLLGRSRSPLIFRLFYLVLSFAWMLLALLWAGANWFTGHGIDDAVLYYLRYGLQGSGFGDFVGFIAATMAAFLLGTVFLVGLFRRFARKYSSGSFRRLFAGVSFLLLLAAFLSNPATLDLVRRNSDLVRRNSRESVKATAGFLKYYRKPQIKASGSERKNLVFIYAESLERTYFDESLFPGLMTNLRNLESKSIHFSDIRQLPGTGFTLGGMTASQCGIPLVTPSNGNSMSGMDKFLPSAVCLGDLLKSEGYFLSYMGGADLNFGGKGKLFKTHGFQEVLGKKALFKDLKDPSYLSAWGVYDDSLLDMAYQRFVSLSQDEKNFGLFLLTLDTHQPKGHLSRSCTDLRYGDGSNPMLNAVACSDQLLADFINKIAASPGAEKTVIVLMSDHLAMKNKASDLLNKGVRKDLLMIFEPGEDQAREVKMTGSTLDVGVTTLPFIGFRGDIGLGRNLLNPSEQEQVKEIRKFLPQWKTQSSSFWDFPKIRKSLAIDPAEETLRIDDRTFRIPILIEANDRLETTLRFQFNRNATQKTLIQYLEEMDDHTDFILVDKCWNTKQLVPGLGGGGYCFIAGRPGAYTETRRLSGKTSWSAEEIRQMLRPPQVDAQKQSAFVVHRVAHAGGGIRGRSYTNSIDALNYNFKRGFRYFDLEFSMTTDGQIVCLHDWEKIFKSSFGIDSTGPLSLKEFAELVATRSEFTNCTLDSLADWMREHPSSSVITDVKGRNLAALKIIRKTLPDAERRVIPQVYNPANFKVVREMGFEQIIWTLYRYGGSEPKILDWVEKFQPPFAVTMPKRWAESDLPTKLAEKGIPTFTHTINSRAAAKKFMSTFGITEIYTDFLPPEQ